MPLLSLPNLCASKICATLDRQHRRDLFGIKILLENEGLTPDLVKRFVVYLVIHNRTKPSSLSGSEGRKIPFRVQPVREG